MGAVIFPLVAEILLLQKNADQWARVTEILFCKKMQQWARAPRDTILQKMQINEPVHRGDTILQKMQINGPARRGMDPRAAEWTRVSRRYS
jgi:hypothetical protein